MLALLRDLDDPKSMVSLVEIHDRRTISAAEKQGLVMIYSPQMVMRTESGAAYILLEEPYDLEKDVWGPAA
jgi:hypothetical protein